MHYIILLSLLLLLGCSQKKVEKEIEKTTKKVIKKQKQDSLIKKETKKEKEFIPKHIRLSHIEVVPH